MGYSWVLALPLMVITNIKNNFSQSVLEEYGMNKDKNFSSVDSNNTNAVFPFVFIKLLPSVENGRDLEGNSINGGLFSFQITVTDNKNQTNTRKVMTEIVRIMKRMCFEVISIPIYEDSKDIHTCTARFRRAIDEGDIL